MPTLDQVNEVMDGLTMLDAHLQVRADGSHLRCMVQSSYKARGSPSMTFCNPLHVCSRAGVSPSAAPADLDLTARCLYPRATPGVT